MRISHLITTALLLTAIPNNAAADDIVATQIAVPDTAQTVEDVIAALRENYVFPDKVPAIATDLEAGLKSGRYRKVTTDQELANALTDDLIRLTGDYHFNLSADQEGARSEKEKHPADQTNPPSILRDVRLLPGNIGYLSIDYFGDPDVSYRKVTSAMNLLSGSDAMIIDLRNNRGGVLELVQFLSSYFFAGDEDHELFRYYYNEGGKRVARSQWVLPALPDTRRPDVPLYILTGSTTFSAGEWMSYMLKNNGRATLVGAVTAGAAHPVDVRRVNSRFIMQVPIGEIRDPHANDDFEGRGVTPDILVAERHALDRARELALEALVAAGDTNAQWFVPKARAWRLPDEQRQRLEQDIVGDYEGRSIKLDTDGLVYSWRKRFSLPIDPIGDDLFAVDNTDDYLIKLVRKGDRVIGLERIMRDGEVEKYARLN